MLRAFSEKGPVNLVDPWVIFGKESRVVTIFSPIMSSQDMVVAEGDAPISIAEQIYGSLIQLGLESLDPVKIIINSTGGSVLPGFMIIQGIEHLKAKGITVITVNQCYSLSMGGIILMMGTKGHRYALQDSLTLTHFGKRSFSVTTHDDKQELEKHSNRIDDRIYELMVDYSTIPEFHVKRQLAQEMVIADPVRVQTDRVLRIKLVRQFLNTNVYMSPEEAEEAGIVDRVLSPGDPLIDEIYKKVNGGAK